MWAFLRLGFISLFTRPRGGPMRPVPAQRVSVAGRSRRVGRFQLDVHPVTNGQYLEFCQATGTPHAPWMFKPGFSDPDQPVVGVTAAEARRYCRWAGKRLPTEAEWLAAVGHHTYPWGDTPPDTTRACFGRKPGARSLDPHPSGTPDPVRQDTAPCRPKGAGPHGHHDLVGLVMEHLERHDGHGTVGRGGFWGSPDPKTSLRVELADGERSSGLGFRAAR